MTVLNFPGSPSPGNTYEENGITYTWTGTHWESVGGGSGGGGATIGTIVAWASSTVPSGWLECNGQNATADLAAVLGQANVPDLRGEFIRGWDHSRGVDADSTRALLSDQGDEFKAHDHPTFVNSAVTGNNRVTGGPTPINDGQVPSNSGSKGGLETRPRNVALMYIIYAGE